MVVIHVDLVQPLYSLGVAHLNRPTALVQPCLQKTMTLFGRLGATTSQHGDDEQLHLFRSQT